MTEHAGPLNVNKSKGKSASKKTRQDKERQMHGRWGGEGEQVEWT